eukprot:260356_1
MLRSIHSAPTALSRELSNSEATQLLKKLYASNQNAQSPSNIAQNAFKIYNNVYERKDKYVINTLLKVLFQHKQSHQISKIWKDIQQTTNISYILLLKSCVQSKPIHMDRCMQVLKWTRQSMHNHPLQPYEIADFSINVSKLIKLSHKSPHNLKQIYSWFGDTDDIFIKTAFIDSFGKIRQIPIAENVFQSIKEHNKNIITINAMMTAYLKNAQYHNVIQLHEQYRCNELIDDTSVLLAIKACTNTKDYTKGMDIIRDHNVNTASIELRNTLIEFYGSCGDIKRAFDTFDHISDDTRDVFALSNIMKACIANDMNLKALELYDTYHALNDNVSHLLALKACINTRNTSLGKHIILNSKHMSIEMLITMIRFYLNSDDIQSALHTFHSIPRQYMNATQIELMMKSCVRRGYGQEALSIYKHFDALNKNDVIHLLAIKTCLQLEAFGVGQDIIDSLHVGSIRKIELLNSIIAFYGKIGDMEKACTVFDLIKKKSTVTINAMMNAYCDNEMHTECVELAMKNIKPDHITFAIAFKSCIHQNALCFGEKMHRYLQQNDSNILASSDVQINLICLYGKNGKLSECEQIFEAIRDKDAMAWHAMMHAFGRNGETERLLQLFDEMCNHKRLSPTDKTYCIVLNACSKDHNGVQTHVLNHLSDTQCINIESLQLQLHEMSVKELYHLLDRFIFCFRILQQHEFVFNDNFCNLPALQVDDSIATDDTLSLQRVFKTVHTIPSAEHRRIIQQLIDALQLSMIESLGNKEWLKILDGFGLMHNIDQMMDAYHQMISSSSSIQRIGSNVLTVLLHHLIRSGETQHAANIWQDIRNDKDTKRFTLNSLVLQSLMLCVNRTRYLYHDEIVHEMWDVMVNERRVKPTLHCSTVALLLSSKYQSKKMYHKILSTLDTSLLTSNHQCFIQILTSCGSSSDMQNMWSFYNKYATVNGHDVMGLTVLASYETREHHMRNILNLVSDLKRAALSTDQLIAFHRVALQCGHKEVQQNMRSVLQEHKIKTNVFAQYRLGDECYFISNGYDSHCAPKLDQLLKEIHYKPNTSVCKQFGQLLSDSATVKHLKHHAEKKALAILIKNNITSIKIKVTMKMCIDCHDFFAKISKKYKDYRIECVDPTGIHLFQNGSCYLCDNLKIGA